MKKARWVVGLLSTMTAFFVAAVITIVISRAVMPRVPVVVPGSVMTAIMVVIDAASG